MFRMNVKYNKYIRQGQSNKPAILTDADSRLPPRTHWLVSPLIGCSEQPRVVVAHSPPGCRCRGTQAWLCLSRVLPLQCTPLNTDETT